MHPEECEANQTSTYVDTDGIDIVLSANSKCLLGPNINGLVTDGNTKLCCRGFILALFQNTTANKIDSEHTQDN